MPSGRFLSGALAVMALTAGACTTDPVSPGLADRRTLPEAVASVPLLQPVQIAQPLPLSEENLGRCNVLVYQPNGGSAREHSIQLANPHGRRPGTPGTELVQVRFVDWDKATKRRLTDVTCVLPLNERSPKDLRIDFRQELEVALASRDREGEPMLRGWGDSEAKAWYGETVWCFNITNSSGQIVAIECDGYECPPSPMLRMADDGQQVYDYVFNCPNGCDVNTSTMQYDCGGGAYGSAEQGAGGGTSGGDGSVWHYSHVQEDGAPTICDLRPLNCTLDSLSTSQRAALQAVLAQLPAWARVVIEKIVNDSTAPDRVQVWADSIYDVGPGCPSPGCLREADVHGAISPANDPPNGVFNPSSLLHLHVSAFNNLRNVVCHEAVHLYWKISEELEDTPAFKEKYDECRLAGAT